MVAQGSAEEGLGLQSGGGDLNRNYSTPILFLLDGLGAEGDAWKPEPLPKALSAIPVGEGGEETQFPSNPKSRSPSTPEAFTRKASALCGPYSLKTATRHKEMDYF